MVNVNVVIKAFLLRWLL